MSEEITRMSKLKLEGNVIDNGWLENLKLKSGKTDMIGIMILSEIVYWYRPTIIRDEDTGEVLGLKKKYKADKLQKSYQSLADRFGFTKDQARDAIKRLKEFGIIDIEFRTIETPLQAINNVMFIGLNIDLLEKITGINRIYQGEKEENTPMGKESDRGMEEIPQGGGKNPIGVGKESDRCREGILEDTEKNPIGVGKESDTNTTITTTTTSSTTTENTTEDRTEREPLPLSPYQEKIKDFYKEIKDEVTDVTFNTWIKSLELKSKSKDKIVFEAPNIFTKEIVDSRYKDLIIKYTKKLYDISDIEIGIKEAS